MNAQNTNQIHKNTLGPTGLYEQMVGIRFDRPKIPKCDADGRTDKKMVKLSRSVCYACRRAIKPEITD